MLIMALSSVAFSGLGRLHVWTVYLDTTVLSFNSLIVFLNFLGRGGTLYRSSFISLFISQLKLLLMKSTSGFLLCALLWQDRQ